MTDKELIMYSRTYGCPFVSLAKRVFEEHGVSYREIFIDQDDEAQERVLDWTGYHSVPTLVVAEVGDDAPYDPPSDIDKTQSPRGIDRGSMITEPNVKQLIAWLADHQFITEEQAAANG